MEDVGQSYVADRAKLAWQPVVPGSIAEELVNFACRSGASAPHRKGAQKP